MYGLLKWLGFCVILSLCPIVFNTVRIIHTENAPGGWDLIQMVLSHGDLSLIAVTVIASALGELCSH